MKRTIAFAVLAGGLGFGHIALAADVARAPVYKAPPPTNVAHDWSGFYAGVHAGWGWSSSANGSASTFTPALPGSSVFIPRSYDLKDDGPLFGGQLGFNWQFGAAVIGIEGDISGTGISGFESGVVTLPAVLGGFTSGTSHMRQDVNWLASIRARLGYTWGSGLLYVTGGAAWANIDYSADANPAGLQTGCCAFPAGFSKTRSGWTIGGGYEWALTPNWTIRTEYLYYNFDGASVVVPVVALFGLAGSTVTYVWDDLDIHVVRVGANYKWGPGNPGRAAPAPAVAQDWSGFYAGVHAGWGWSSSANGSASTFTPGLTGPVFLSRGYDLKDDGPLFGGQLGFNWQFGAAVIGIEGDISGTGISGFESGAVTLPAVLGGFTGGTSHMRQDVNWLASIRARLGYTWGSGLLYVTGGAAWANIDYSADANPTGIAVDCCAFPAGFSKTQSGWTIGGGYEWALRPNWTIRTEYLYYNFDGASVVAAPVLPSGSGFAGSTATYVWDDLNIHAVRIALNYKW